MLCRIWAFCWIRLLPLLTRSGDSAPSRYSHTGRVNSGWLRSALITLMSGLTPMNARSNRSPRIPAASASLRNPACHCAKVWVGAMARSSPVGTRGGTMAGAVTAGAVWSGWASAAVGFSAQATSRATLAATIIWRSGQRWERQKGMHGSRNTNQVLTLTCERGVGLVLVFQAARKQEASQLSDWKASRR